MRIFFYYILFFVLFLQNLFSSESAVCIPSTRDGEIQHFFNLINASLANTKLQNGFFHTGYGLKIEASCEGRMPIKKLESFYRETMAEGTKCLKNLAHLGNEGSKNIKCFDDLFLNKSNPPQVLCGGWPFGSDIHAVGSFPGSSKRHPYLWLSPKTSDLINSNPNELRATIFHEMLHNCGYTHSAGIEITYTCEECCFNYSLGEKEKESACHICAGKYQDENDSKYVEALLRWSAPYDLWAKTMRMRAIEVAIQSKNRASLKIILNEAEINSTQMEMLIEILLSSDQKLIKNKVLDFIKNNNLIMNRTFEILLKKI